MPSPRFIYLSVLLFVLAMGTAAAEGKITIDPNSPEARAAVAEVAESASEPRLATRVTYSAKRKCVSKILSDLSAQTSVTLNAGYNEKDWQVQDRRMNVFVKDMPLSDLMSSISRTMKFKWRKSGERGNEAYRLYMDRAAVLSEEIKRQKEADAINEQLKEARRRLVDSIGQVADLSGEDLAKLKEDNPYLWVLASSGAAKGMNGFLNNCPEAMSAFTSGSKYYGTASNLPPAARQAMIDGVVPASYNLQLTGLIGGSLAAVAGNPDKVHFWLNLGGDPTQGVIGCIEVEIPLESGGSWSFPLPLHDPATDDAQLEAKVLIAKLDKPDDPNEMWTAHGKAQMARQLKPVFKSPEDCEPLAKHPDDTDLKKKTEIKLDPNKRYYAEDIEELIAQRFELNLVGDAYNREPVVNLTGITSIELAGLLSKLEDECKSNWWKRGSLAEVRDRYWFKRRAEQVPEAWLAYWREAFKSTGTLDLDDLALIAALSSEQYAANIEEDETLSAGLGTESELCKVVRLPKGNILPDYRAPLLKFYAGLTAKQKALVLSEKGLDLFGIRRDQVGTMQVFVGGPENPWSLLRAGSGVTALRLFGTRKANGKLTDYWFWITAKKQNKEEQEDKAKFTAPKYVKLKLASTPGQQMSHLP